jgi:hypothetical protein
MTDRISFGQVILAAVYAAPLMAIPMVAASNNWLFGVRLSRLIGPLIVGVVLLLVPAIVANVVSRCLIGWWGSGLSGTAFHITVGVLAGALLIWIVDLAARGTVQIGGGPLGAQSLFGMALAACCNGMMIFAVWHFGWKSAYD